MANFKEDFIRCKCGKALFTKREVLLLKDVRSKYVESRNTIQYVCLNCGEIIEEKSK